MYYVNREQIDLRLACIPDIAHALEQIRSGWDGSLLLGLAQERAIHLAIEAVTDIGSYLIDGFIMRDASSYEDIVEIIGGEGVFSASLIGPLTTLVKQRKPLVQEYYSISRTELHPLVTELPATLREFAEAVTQYLRKELG